MSLSSLDTNILLYAANEDCAEHGPCKDLLGTAVAKPDRWIIADQVFIELYKALRNAKVLARPLTGPAAARHIRILREDLGFMRCGYSTACWEFLFAHLAKPDFPYQRTHDAVLAATLLKQGVTIFYTRNTKDFRSAGFQEVIDPLAAESILAEQ